MNYKELLEKYRSGQASSEETQMIEQELEKFLALEDHLAQSFEDSFPEKENSLREEIPEAKRINQKVNQRLRKVVLTSVAIVVGLYLLIFQVLSGFMNHMYYNPASTSMSKGAPFPVKNIETDLSALTSLNFPGLELYLSPTTVSTGFGRHTVSYRLMDRFSLDLEGYSIALNRGLPALDFEGQHGLGYYRWEEGLRGFMHLQIPDAEGRTSWTKLAEHFTEKTLEQLKVLHPSAYVSISLTFGKDHSAESIYQLLDKFPELRIAWVGVRTMDEVSDWKYNNQAQLIGFNPNFEQTQTNALPNEDKYPLFYLSSVMRHKEFLKGEHSVGMANAAEIHYQSRLQYLIDRPAFVKAFDLYGNLKTNFYKDALAYVKQHGIQSYGVVAYATAEDWIKLLEELDYHTLYINQVSSMKPSRDFYSN